MNELDRAWEQATAVYDEERKAAPKNMGLVAAAVHFYIVENAPKGVTSVKISKETPFGYDNKCEHCDGYRVYSGDAKLIMSALSAHDTYKVRYRHELGGGCDNCYSHLYIRIEGRRRGCCTQ